MTRLSPRDLSLLSIPLLMLMLLVGLVNTSYYEQYPPELALGVTLDFLLTVPLVYALVIWRKNIPRITIASVFVGCSLMASYVLPAGDQGLLDQIRYWLFPVVELALIAYLLYTTRKTLLRYRVEKKADVDFYSALRSACRAVLPARMAFFLSFEIAVIYYAFFASKKPLTNPNYYTYYKKNGIVAVIYVVVFLILVETLALHLVLERWSATVAWILTAISAYTSLQFFALIRSMSRRLIVVDEENGQLHLRYGFFNETTISLEDVKDCTITRRLPKEREVILFSPLGNLDNHNIILDLNREYTLYRMYGLQKQFRSLAIYVDDKESFLEQLNLEKKRQ